MSDRIREKQPAKREKGRDVFFLVRLERKKDRMFVKLPAGLPDI